MKITSDDFPWEYYEKRTSIITSEIMKTCHLNELSDTLSKVSTTKAHLERYQASMNELFCENS